MHLISIITPFYNCEKYLAQSIASVQQQTHPYWELILIDDGSSDQSARIAQDYARQDERIVYLYQQNKGVSAARNRGIRAMSGDYFCFLDGDDIWPANSLKSRLQTLIDSQLDCVDGSIARFENDTSLAVRSYTPQFTGVPLRELVTLTGSCFSAPTWLCKHLPQLIPFQEEITHGEDLLFFIQNFGSRTFGYTTDLVLYYRMTPGSAMTNLTGLENGYRRIYEHLRADPRVGEKDLRRMKRRVKRCMILDYLKKKDAKSITRMIRW